MEAFLGIMVPISFFVMIAVIVAVSVWGSVQGKRAIADTMRRAIESGRSIDADAISAIQRPTRSREADLRGAIIMIFLAGGLCAAGFMVAGGIPDEQGAYWAGNGLFIAAVIIGAIGVGQLIAALVTRRRKEGE
jgi:hypothetical protein